MKSSEMQSSELLVSLNIGPELQIRLLRRLVDVVFDPVIQNGLEACGVIFESSEGQCGVPSLL